MNSYLEDALLDDLPEEKLDHTSGGENYHYYNPWKCNSCGYVWDSGDFCYNCPKCGAAVH